MNCIEFDEICTSCNGTGLYVGYAEHDGWAVQCFKCKGTGKYHFVHKYEPFIIRKGRKGIKRVLENNPGISVGGKLDFGGISFKEWKNGNGFKNGTEMRNFTCPAWWYQSTDSNKKPNRKECADMSGCSFSSCKSFSTKEKCWKRFDKRIK